MADLPVILVLGVSEIELKSTGPVPSFETQDMICHCYLTDKDLPFLLAKENPVVVVTIGNSRSDFPNVLKAPDFVKRMWCHYKPETDLSVMGKEVFECFLANTLRKTPEMPLVSVITPVYKTGDKILKPYHSLLAQSYQDWEWIIIDDSDDEGETLKRVQELEKSDSRIHVYKTKHSGVIGKVKRDGFNLARGKYLVELDHDDQLAPRCLDWLVEGYNKYPDVGFIYTDFAECSEGGEKVEYGPGWGLGYGSYRTEIHNGMEYSVVNSPHINAKTIRHIVAAPNHVRSWRADLYHKIGGHSDNLHVADDYELMIRTFLETRMGHIPKMGYIQYRNLSGNTHKQRIYDIQRLVRYISMTYDKDIHKRLLELEVDDFIWSDNPELPTFLKLNTPPQEEESHCTVTIDILK